MVRDRFSNKTGFAAVATALAMLALPAVVFAQDTEHERRGGWSGRGESAVQGDAAGRGGAWSRGAEGQGDAATRGGASVRGADQSPRGWNSGGSVQTRSAPVVQAPIPAPIPAPAQTARGWGAGRDWQGGTSAPRAAEPQRSAPQRGQAGNWQGHDGGSSRVDGGNQHNDRGWNNRGRQEAPHTTSRAWSRDWSHDNRYDWRSWRESNRDTFRIGRYFAPYRGYSYRRLSLGFLLDPLFFDDQYVIENPWAYHLPPAYEPYLWVRYYNDAVLVDSYTGRVVDVIYDVFW